MLFDQPFIGASFESQEFGIAKRKYRRRSQSTVEECHLTDGLAGLDACNQGVVTILATNSYAERSRRHNIKCSTDLALAK